jgi:hypothetical protein
MPSLSHAFISYADLLFCKQLQRYDENIIKILHMQFLRPVADHYVLSIKRNENIQKELKPLISNPKELIRYGRSLIIWRGSPRESLNLPGIINHDEKETPVASGRSDGITRESTSKTAVEKQYQHTGIFALG